MELQCNVFKLTLNVEMRENTIKMCIKEPLAASNQLIKQLVKFSL